VLTAFEDYIQSFELVPGSGGDFEFTVEGELAYSKRKTGRYPELSELKEAVAKHLK
jgi:selenoprotein W-related protein